jgi:CRP/FNR family cyclic AMP-dependent transcriptional regulator
LQLIHSRKRRDSLPRRSAVNFLKEDIRFSEKSRTVEFPMFISTEVDWDSSRWPSETGKFIRRMSESERRDFELLATPVQCFPDKVLIAEEQQPLNILFLLEGEVNVSMNSLTGRQFLLGVAGAGEILGLASAISGDSSEIRAVARHPCRIASLSRRDFLDFLLHHPSSSNHIALELSLHCRRVSERLRIFGLTTSVPARLASLLLAWCKDGRQTENGTQIRSVLTQGEIGDCIGASRETITRTLTDFKNQDLVRVNGSTLIIPSRTALAMYAGIDSVSNWNDPAS